MYVLEFLLGQYCSSDDDAVIEQGVQNVKKILAENFVRPDEAQKVLSRLRKKGSYTVIDMVTARLDMKRNLYVASFSNLGITNVLLDDEYPEKYDRLRSIDLDTVLIVHQKSSLTSSHPYKNDAKTVGEEKFQEFVYTDYFEAFEFKNRKNEVFNKNFLNAQDLTEDIRFITGSDCHDWRYYPKETEKDNTDFVYTYVKCLPCFRGLVMAITDHRRIKTVNSFFRWHG